MNSRDAPRRPLAGSGRWCPEGAAWASDPGAMRLSAEVLAERGRQEVRKLLAARREALERQGQRQLAASGIPTRFQGQGFADDHRPLAEQARASGQDFATLLCADDRLGETLLLLGAAGTGKTHLACAILATVIRAGRSGWYTSWSMALRGLRDAGTRRSDCSETDAFAQLSEPDLLVLDEVRGTDASGQDGVLFEILDARYAQRRATILISELSRASLEAFLGPRLMRRLHEGGLRQVTCTWPGEPDHAPCRLAQRHRQLQHRAVSRMLPESR